MVQTGAPDYQQFANWSDVALFSGTVSGSTPGVAVGTFNVSQWAGLQLYASAITQSCGIFVSFYADAALTELVGGRLVHLNNLLLGPSSITVPVQGLFAVVTCKTNGAVPNVCLLTISPTNRIGSPAASVNFPHLFEQNAVAVPAVTQVNQNAQYLYAGPAHLSFSSALANWQIQLVYFDYLGNAHGFFLEAFGAASLSNFRSSVMIPPAPCQLQLFNNTGAPGTISAFVMPGDYASAA